MSFLFSSFHSLQVVPMWIQRYYTIYMRLPVLFGWWNWIGRCFSLVNSIQFQFQFITRNRFSHIFFISIIMMISIRPQSFELIWTPDIPPFGLSFFFLSHLANCRKIGWFMCQFCATTKFRILLMMNAKCNRRTCGFGWLLSFGLWNKTN